MAPKRKSSEAGNGSLSASPAKKSRSNAATRDGAAAKGKPLKSSSGKSVREKAPKAKTDVDTTPKTKAEKKAAVLAKKEKKKPVMGLVHQCVHIWEDLRPRDATPEVKAKLISQVVTKAKGHFKELALNHSSARVVQAVLKHGSSSDRQIVWNDCKEHLAELSISVYGNHVVRKLIDTAKKAELPGILRTFKGHVPKLFRHPCGSAVLADLYDALPTTERNVLVSEFYGKEYALFGSAQSAAGKLSSLPQAWDAMDGRKRRAVMQSLILGLQPVIEKGYLDPPPIHRLVSEYLQLAPSDMVQDAVELLSSQSLLRMVHTHDGSRAGCMVAAYGTPKDRKKLVKAMKTHVAKMALDEFAYVVLIKVLSCVDDTQLVRKNVVCDLVEDVGDVVESKHGCKVLLALLHEGGLRHLPPHARSMLRPATRMVAVRPEPAHDGDTAMDASDAAPVEPEMVEMGLSKKDDDVRRQEVWGAGNGSLSAAVIGYCASHADTLMRTPHGADLIAELCSGPATHFLWAHAEDDVRKLQLAVAACAGGSAVPAETAATPDASAADAASDGDAAEPEDDDEASDAEHVKDGDAAPPAGPAAGPAAAPAESLLVNYFASRALRRMVTGDGGCDGARCAFAEALWGAAFDGRCAEHVGTHAAKIAAALAECDAVGVRDAARKELAGCVEGNLDAWIAGFTPKPRQGQDAQRAKAPKKGKVLKNMSKGSLKSK